MPFVVQTATPAHATAAYNQAQGILRRVTPTAAGTKGQVLAQPPKPLASQDLGEDARGPARVGDITRNVVTQPQEKAAWDAVLRDILHSSTNEVGLRQSLFAAVKASPLEPAAGQHILRRAVRLWRQRRAQA